MNEDSIFWDIIDNEWGIYDVLDENQPAFNNIFYTMITPVPGVIIMINEDFYGKEER